MVGFGSVPKQTLRSDIYPTAVTRSDIIVISIENLPLTDEDPEIAVTLCLNDETLSETP